MIFITYLINIQINGTISKKTKNHRLILPSKHLYIDWTIGKLSELFDSNF